MGEVWRARHRHLAGRGAAVKLLPAGLASGPDFVRRFLREAHSAAALDHPHILAVLDYGEQDGIPYLVMPLIAGGSLKERLLRQPIAAHALADYLRPIADALDYAHGRGVIHRDVKPANILVERDGDGERLYLADFGLAGTFAGDESGLTEAGAIVGTPEYIAPEQARGEPGPSSDAYALGVIAYQALTGRVPFRGATPVAIVLKHLNDPPTPLRASNPALPPRVEEVVGRALAKDPADRYPTAGAFIGALADALAGTDSTVAIPPASSAAAVTPVLPASTRGAAPPTQEGGAAAVTGKPVGRFSRWRARPAALGLVTIAVPVAGSTGGTASAPVAAAATVRVGATATGAATSSAAGTATGATAWSTATGAPAGTAAGGGIPFDFPITQATIEGHYGRAAAAARARSADHRLRDFVINCANPRAAADCRISYHFYSADADTLYEYFVFVRGTVPMGEREQPAADNSQRVTYLREPWIGAPDWALLLGESYAMLPAGYGTGGFTFLLTSPSYAPNQGLFDWVATYRSQGNEPAIQFTMRGTTVRRIS